MTVARWILLLLITIYAPALTANTCITPKPLSLTEVCGRVVDPNGASLPDVELRLLDGDKNAAASVRTDSNGNFIFGPIEPGDYSLSSIAPGFEDVYWPVRVTKSVKSKACKRPLQVQVAPGTGSCGSNVSRKGYKPF